MRLALLLALAACGKKAEEPAPAPVASDAAADAAVPVDAAEDRCRQPCLLLRDATLVAVRAECAGWLADETPAGCDEIDFARNCVYASYGYAFKKARWRQAFGALPWYKPAPGEPALSGTAVANVAELKQRAAACRDKVASAISPATRTAIDEWFKARARDWIPVVPARVTDLDGQPIDRRAFIKRYLGKDSRLFRRHPWEPLVFVEKRGAAEVVEVATGMPDPATCKGGGEDCEGFEAIRFIVTDGRITAIETVAAG